MRSLMFPFSTLVMRLFLILSIFALSAQTSSLNSSTFVYKQAVANITFTLTAVADTNDLLFRLSAPAEYDWVAIGIGANMTGALMFLVYPAKNGTAIMLSPRLSTGNTEPAYSPHVALSTVSDPNLPNYIDARSGGQLMLTAICRNCTSWPNPPLDLNSTQAPFMFAFGPISDQTTAGWFNGAASGSARWSNSLKAPLRSHSIYGTFTMDMQQATVSTNPNSQLPALGSSTSGASSMADVVYIPHDYRSAVHAITMCLVFALFMPLDSFLRMFSKRIGIHIFMISFATVIFIVGLVLGVMLSPEFVRSKRFDSAHQVIGFIVVAFFVIQFALGAFAHRNANAEQTSANQRTTTAPPKSSRRIPTFSIANTHIAIGILIFLFAAIDVGIGFDFAISPNYNKMWAPVIIGVTLFYLVIFGIRYFFAKSKKDSAAERELEKEIELLRQMPTNAPPGGKYADSAPPSYSAQGLGGQRDYLSQDISHVRNDGGEGRVEYQSVTVPKPFY